MLIICGIISIQNSNSSVLEEILRTFWSMSLTVQMGETEACGHTAMTPAESEPELKPLANQCGLLVNGKCSGEEN